MKLITELNQNIKPVIEESTGGVKTFKINGPFMQSEIVNKNGRFYPKSVMENAVTKYITEKINNKTAYGELSHPKSPKINEDRISHLITKLEWDNNDVYGEAVIFNTDMGRIVKAIIEGGGNLGVSSRGLGSIKKDNNKAIVENFFIATAADIVTDPSAPKAFINGIMEDVEWLYDEANDSFIQQLHETKKEINKLSLKQIEENKFQIFNKFIKNLSKH